ncbi:MAG: tetratricopeptide repeat protein, partial [Pseudomonadales bacterium]|nr:tetratricopeptide repeat protein [Pseudomonadales bacterium]
NQSNNPPTSRRKYAETLLLENRELLQHLLKHNEAVVRHYQEHELDKMADPVKFFESEQWQMPQKLISLASYWSGWNGYYASLLMEPDLALRKTILNESIEMFSRSFIDFAEDEITTKSLYGRGLVYKQLEIFGRAAYDFKSVKQRVGREHPLYLSCLYQEALISYEKGNIRVAGAILNSIHSNYLQEDIPESIRLGIKKLEAQFIISPDGEASKIPPMIAKPSTQTSDQTTKLIPDKSSIEVTKSLSKTEINSRFQLLKSMAYDDSELFDQFYQYSKQNFTELTSLSYEELTPIGALAVADSYFELKKFDAALALYQPLLKNKPEIIQSHADGVWLRSAYIYNHQKKWSMATDLLAGFSKQFPDSRYLEQVAELYYSAAISLQRSAKTRSNHQTYIQASLNYVEHCQSCPRIDDAQYELGRYYIRQHKRAAALSAFSKVQPGSTHYFIASFHVAEAQISALESLARKGDLQSSEATTRHKVAKQILTRYRNTGIKDKAAAPLRPNWTLLQARFSLLPIAPDYAAAIAQLEGFNSLLPKDNTATPLRIRAATVRAIAYQRLEQLQQFETTITRLADKASGASSSASASYQALQRLGNRFYHEAAIIPVNRDSTKPTPEQTQAMNAARFIYQQLAVISTNQTSTQKHLSAVKFRLAELYRRNQQLPQAVKIYRELINQNPDSADTLYALGHTYREMEQWRNALETWRQLSDGLDAGSPHWFEARYQTALSMRKLNRGDKACSIAKMTRILHPNLETSEFVQQFSTLETQSCEPAK